MKEDKTGKRNNGRESKTSRHPNARQDDGDSAEDTQHNTPKHYVETVVFIPYTPGGALRKMLQREDNKLAAMFKQPRV